MEKNHKEISEGKMNDEICIKFDNPNKLVYQKHWDENDMYFSKMTRPGVELLKRDFKSDLNKEEWSLTAKIVKSLKI